MPHWLHIVYKNFETALFIKFAFLTYTPSTFNNINAMTINWNIHKLYFLYTCNISIYCACSSHLARSLNFYAFILILYRRSVKQWFFHYQKFLNWNFPVSPQCSQWNTQKCLLKSSAIFNFLKIFSSYHLIPKLTQRNDF